MSPVRHRLYRTGRKKSAGRTQPMTDSTTQPVESSPRLPHERDESSDSQTKEEPHPEMVQAHADVEAGLVDTDRAVPMDRAYQKQKDPAQR
jgi:hypothetical protein